MRKKQLVGMVLIIGLISGLLPVIVFGITSFPTYQTSNDANAWEDYNWYESNDADSEAPPSHNPATSTNRTDTQFTYSACTSYRWEIPSSIREAEVTYTKIWINLGATQGDVTAVYFLDRSKNILHIASTTSKTSKGDNWYEIDFDDWSGFPNWTQVNFDAATHVQTAATNTYDDELYDAGWSDDPRDGMLIIYYVASFGYQESFTDDSEWSTYQATITEDNDIATITSTNPASYSCYVYIDELNIDGGTYQFIEISVTDTDESGSDSDYWFFRLYDSQANWWQYWVGYTGTGVFTLNLEESDQGYPVEEIRIFVRYGIYVKIDYIRIYRFYEWTDAESDGDGDNYAYEDSNNLVVSLDANKYLNLTDDVTNFNTDDFPYCRLETSAGTVGVTLIDSGDAELETKNFTASTDTQQFSFGLAVDEIRLQIYDDMTIDFITFSVGNITITDVTTNLEDTWASPDQSISITGITGEWGDGTSITANNLQWFDLKENSTWIETNQTSTSTAVSLYNATYEVGVGHCNDSRYRYFTGGTNYTFWMIGTEVTGNFYYDVQRIADVNYIITFYQTGQLAWENGSIITTQPEVYSYLNTTENGYRVLGDDAWLPDGVYPVSVTNTQGQYETTFAFNLTTGDFWEEFYSTDIIPIDKVESHLIFSFYSSYDGFGLPNELLKIYVDDTRVYHNEHWSAGNTINLTITDYFNNSVEWTASGMVYPDYEFTAADIVFIDLGLAFYPLQFFNPGDHDLIVELTSNTITKNITVPVKGFSNPYRVIATTFTYKVFYMTENQGETTTYEYNSDQDYSVTVSSESYDFELPGIHDPEPSYGGGGGGTPFWFVVFVILGVFGAAIGVGFIMRKGGKEETPLVPPEPYEPYRKYKTQEDAYIASQNDANKKRKKAEEELKKRLRGK